MDFDYLKVVAKSLPDDVLIEEYKSLEKMCDGKSSDSYVFVDYYIDMLFLLAAEMCDRFIVRCR